MPLPAGTDITAVLLNSLPVPLDTLAVASVTNSAAETLIGSFANGIPANDAAFNSGYRFRITGTWDSTATPTIRFRLYLGVTFSSSQRIYDSGLLTGSGTNTNEPFWIDAFMICTQSGASGTFDSGGVGSFVNVTAGQPISSNFTAQNINTLFVRQIQLSAQFGTASPSNTARTLSGIMGRL